MKGSDILALAKAGFSLDQIVQIDEALTLPGEDPAQSTPEPAAPAPDADKAAEAINNASAQLQSTLEKIQKMNIASKEQPASEVETTDSILGNLIKGTPIPGREG